MKSLLVKAKKHDEKISKLQEKNPEAASKLKEKKLWQNALEKCDGNKVRDDAHLLEKKLKTKTKQKVKSAKAWDERKKSVEKRKQMKQEKRTKHIKERKDSKKNKKVKLLKKKGRILN